MALAQHFAQDVYQEQPLYFQIIVLERQIYAWIGSAPPRLGSLCMATPTPLVRRRRRRCRRCCPKWPARRLSIHLLMLRPLCRTPCLPPRRCCGPRAPMMS